MGLMNARPRTRVSVVIPTCNRDGLLRQALGSVLANGAPGLELEVLVIDNGNGDETADLAGEFGARYVRRSSGGAAAARNRGLEEATGEYVAFLDDDDLWTPGHLRQQVEWLAEHPDFGAVLGRIQNIDLEL